MSTETRLSSKSNRKKAITDSYWLYEILTFPGFQAVNFLSLFGSLNQCISFRRGEFSTGDLIESKSENTFRENK